MQVNLPSVSDQPAAKDTFTLVLSEESIGLLNLALAAVCTDALDAGVTPDRAFHLMRDWHATRSALEALASTVTIHAQPFPGL